MPLFPLGIDVFSGNMISKNFLNESILLQFLHCLQKCAGQLIDMKFLTLFFLKCILDILSKCLILRNRDVLE